MNTTIIKYMFTLLNISIIFSGCVSISSPSSTFIDKTNTPIDIEYPVQESTKVSTPTIHTLTQATKDDYTYLINLLKNNGDCSLPCFWGITPGKSKFEEARQILLPLNEISDSLNLNPIGVSNFNMVYKEIDLGVHLNLNFNTSSNNDVVNWVSLTSWALRELSQGNFEDINNSVLYEQLLRIYSMPNILTAYGEPTTILLRTNSELPSQGKGDFNVLLLYYDKGILAHYKMPMEVHESNIVGCPENSTIELFLVDPVGIESANDLLEIYSDPYKFEDIYGHYKPINEATSLSLSEFVKIFSGFSSNCIETPAYYWTPP